MITPGGEALRIGNRYRLEEQIGIGAMGVVWRGTDELLNRPVAVKELLTVAPSTNPAEVEESRQRIQREGRIGARLQHAHVISMFDVVIHEDRPWLVMEYLPSDSLATVVRAKGPLLPVQVAAIGRDVADGLAAAHAAGVVHRDVKPGNVLIGTDGRVKLTDFGVARAVDDVQLTRTGLIAGTPAFLAPEIAQGRTPTAASDVFALGATLYAAVEGVPPFGLDDNAYALLHKVATEAPNPPQHAGPLTPVLMRLLAVDPAARPSAAQARDLLAAVATGQAVPEVPTDDGRPRAGGPLGPVDATRPGAARPPPPAARPPRRRAPVLIGAAVALLAIGGGAAAFALTRRSGGARSRSADRRGGAHRGAPADGERRRSDHGGAAPHDLRCGRDRPDHVRPALLRAAARQPRSGFRAAFPERTARVGWPRHLRAVLRGHVPGDGAGPEADGRQHRQRQHPVRPQGRLDQQRVLSLRDEHRHERLDGDGELLPLIGRCTDHLQAVCSTGSDRWPATHVTTSRTNRARLSTPCTSWPSSSNSRKPGRRRGPAAHPRSARPPRAARWCRTPRARPGAAR